MATKRAPRTSATTKKHVPVVTRTSALVLLIVGLALSAYNLALMTSKAGSLVGISESWTTLRDNYASSYGVSEPPAPAEVVAQPAPAVLSSVVAYRDGEQEKLQQDLVAPLLSYYEVAPAPALKAVLIERKNAGSRDVNVRLFFIDGTETAYLWPSTNATDGRWTPPCAPTTDAVNEDLPLCPERFRTADPVTSVE